ncbi:hypothetical protein BN165_1040035 [Clostridioides difficile E1]|nr:hypothetical protein BN163_1130037 [Clostridioides difficile T5]CCK94166.1 hypothetical protein BN165_1040035 [Clostridioides difficile E1]
MCAYHKNDGRCAEKSDCRIPAASETEKC